MPLDIISLYYGGNLVRLFILLFISDYVLTYVGLSNGIIEEGNPFMKYLMQLPFYQGLLIRIAYLSILTFMLWIGRKTKLYKQALKIINGVYIFVFFLHLHWVFDYLSYTL